MTVLLVVVLSGCGAKSNVSKSSQPVNSPVDQSSNQQSGSSSSGSIAQQQAQVQSINTKTTQGQAEVDQKIDQHLQLLDKALDSLDKSLGNL
ncbi:hypothetical protein [Desulfosporosinus sp. Sb-LF]|uniref:hypothetical protein n=1 Tax=Desulfosporosinus sp. Sb-LF TaxID=2560027 RepID=UPI001105622B|nr:hypothetical protein [Desulfosporosinus sp. Sb-LF]TGE33121.1 hypothetical protein E4K68_09865 [Desulfosporosinus sp. Sb-LF]